MKAGCHLKTCKKVSIVGERVIEDIEILKHTHMHKYTYEYIDAGTHIYTFVYTCTHIHKCTDTYLHINIHRHRYAHIFHIHDMHTQIHTHTRIVMEQVIMMMGRACFEDFPSPHLFRKDCH